MKKQEQIYRELLRKGYVYVSTETIGLNGRYFKVIIMTSPEGEKVIINHRGTINSKNSLASAIAN